MDQIPESDGEEQQIKIMTLGNSSVGKTSFILKYTENSFNEKYASTIGIDYKIKVLKIKERNYKLFLYDTTGQERFRSLAYNLIKNADGILLMYDITNKESFQSIPEWIKNIKEKRGNDFPIILLGNKIDLEEKREVKKEDGEDFAEGHKIKFFEISNKEGINIDEACLTLLLEILTNFKKNEKSFNASVLSTYSFKEKKSKKCC